LFHLARSPLHTHTVEVTGSNPVPPTRTNPRGCGLRPDPLLFFVIERRQGKIHHPFSGKRPALDHMTAGLLRRSGRRHTGAPGEQPRQDNRHGKFFPRRFHGQPPVPENQLVIRLKIIVSGWVSTKVIISYRQFLSTPGLTPAGKQLPEKGNRQ
jgi:hypothetical protein